MNDQAKKYLQTKELCLKFFQKVIFRVGSDRLTDVTSWHLVFICYYAISTRLIETRPDLLYEITLEVLFEILAIEAVRQNSREKMLLWTNFRQNSIVSRHPSA